MKEFLQFIIAIILGVVIALAVLTHYPCVQMESDFKVNPDYRLEANDKVIDTIWIYKARNKE
jgi:hypothetical protein